MANYILFYYPYASFTDAQLPLLKVAALWFDKLVILDPVGASWDTIGADRIARDAVRELKGAGILEIVMQATVLAKYERSLADAIRRDMADREFVDLCTAQSEATGKQRWTLSLAKVPQDVQTDQAMRHLMGDFARRGKKGEERCLYMQTDELLKPQRRISHMPNSSHRITSVQDGFNSDGALYPDQ